MNLQLTKEEQELLIRLLTKENERLADWLQKIAKPSQVENVANRLKVAENLLKRIIEP